jgi:ABC-type branched-subunit amino acid transport system ATPase component
VTAASLDVRDLVVSFGGLRAVDGVSFSCRPGAVVGILGPNGSGKTTLLDAISGQVRPASGAVHLDGVDLIDYQPEDRADLGLIRSFQDCRLFPELSVSDTLLVAEDARRPVGVAGITFGLPGARRTEAVKRHRVDDLLSAFGLGAFRDRRIDQLSTGTRRIVDLAVIAASAPRLLVLDEPTAGIAQREAEALGPVLRTLHEETGATMLIVEHDVPMTVALCPGLIVMETGRIVSAGPTAQVLADPIAADAYLGASAEAVARSGAPAAGTARRDGG